MRNFLFYLEIVHVDTVLLKLSGMECERQYMVFLSWPKGLLKSLWRCLHEEILCLILALIYRLN